MFRRIYTYKSSGELIYFYYSLTSQNVFLSRIKVFVLNPKWFKIITFQGTLAKQILAEPEEITAMNGQRLPLRMQV